LNTFDEKDADEKKIENHAGIISENERQDIWKYITSNGMPAAPDAVPDRASISPACFAKDIDNCSGL
jgi:hypothetical protein